MKQNCDDLFPLSPTPSEASDGAVTEAHGGGNPVGVSWFQWLGACVLRAVSCSRKMHVRLRRGRLCHAGSFFLAHMRLHGVSMLRLIGRHITHNLAHTLRLAHIVHNLHVRVFLRLSLCLPGSCFLLGFIKSEVWRIHVNSY